MIHFEVRGQALSVFLPPATTSDTLAYLSASFDFNSKWDGLNKWLHLRDENGQTYDIEIVNDTIVPGGLNLSAGRWEAWIHGTEMPTDRTGDGPTMRIVTANVSFDVDASGMMSFGPLPPIETTAAEQIAANARYARDQVDALRREWEKLKPGINSISTEAKSWAVGGTGSREGEDTDNSKYYAEQAREYGRTVTVTFTGPLSGELSSDKTYAEAVEALSRGAVLEAKYGNAILHISGKGRILVFVAIPYVDSGVDKGLVIRMGSDGAYGSEFDIGGSSGPLEELTFTGAAKGTYDGTMPLTVHIPDGSSAGGALYVTFEKTGDKEVSYDVPFKEIHAAMEANTPVYGIYDGHVLRATTWGPIHVYFTCYPGYEGDDGWNYGQSIIVMDDETNIGELTLAKIGKSEVFTATITDEVGRLVCDMTSAEIIDADRIGVVKAEYTDPATDEIRTYYYFKQTKDRRAVFAKDGYIEDGVMKSSLIYVDSSGYVTVETRPLRLPVGLATCDDVAASPTSSPNVWYIPKTVPRPSGIPGMMLDVKWTNGHVGGLGYNVSLIWGEAGGADNEVIVDPSSVSGGPQDVSVPVGGTVRYQLVDSGSRMSWKYVSGNLLKKQYSTATAPDTAEKVVPGLSGGYLPGMDIYLQVDKGNTSDTMTLVPADGQSLPVYGNGRGKTTGTIPAGYILHLKNAGDHWQIVNQPGGSEGSEIVRYTCSDAANEAEKVQLAKTRATPPALKDIFIVSFTEGNTASTMNLHFGSAVYAVTGDLAMSPGYEAQFYVAKHDPAGLSNEVILLNPDSSIPIRELNESYDSTVKRVESKIVNVADNILKTNAKLSPGWTGDNGTGYTHTSGSTPLVFETPTESGAVYVCRLTTSFTADEFGKISIGDGYGVLCYNGRNNLTIPLAADGGYFKITPLDTFKGTLTNIRLQKVSDVGETLALALTAILSPGHDSLLGFRNIVIGDSLFKSPNSTRTVCIGDQAMNDTEVGHRTICIGGSAMQHFKAGENNIAIGADAMFSLESGSDNIALGVSALGSGAGDENVAIGRAALNGNSKSKNQNIAIGKYAGNTTDGGKNVIIGYNAGSSMRENARANVLIGTNAVGGKRAYNSVAIGTTSRFGDDANFAIAIGAGAYATKAGQIVIGGANTSEVILGKKKLKFNPDGTVTWTTV